MPKKPARNAFYFFMKDLEPQLRKEGRVFPHGMQDLVPIAHPRWKALPENEKQRYEKIAKEYKARMRGAEGDKFRMDNVGNILSERRDGRTELERKRNKDRNLAKSNWPAGSALADEPFYFIKFQTLCKTMDGDYLPAEIGAIEYTIRKGITKKLHRFIQAGKIPTGYRFECKQKSEEEHQIPAENFDKADNNFRGLWIQLENFVNPNGEKPEYPPLYCLIYFRDLQFINKGTSLQRVEQRLITNKHSDDFEETDYCLRWIHDRAALGIPNRLKKLYALEDLFVDMYVHNGSIKVSESQAVDLLTATTWDYEPKTKCDYHEELECKYCALGFVQRYAFAISDTLCPIYEVQLTDKHIPIRAEGSIPYVALPVTTMMVDPNQDARLPNRGRNQPSVKSIPRNNVPPRFTQQNRPSQPQFDDNESEEDESDESDDESSRTLRRPNIPASAFAGGSGMQMGRGATGVSAGRGAPSLAVGRGAAPVAPVGRGSSFTGMGRGLAPTIDNDVETKKFAGRASAPAPSSAPPPPAAWQMNNNSQMSGGLQPNPLVQGVSQVPGGQRPVGPRPLYNPMPSVPPGFSPMSSMMPRPSGPGMVPQQLPTPTHNGSIPSPVLQSPTMAGVVRGRGRGILQTAMSSTKSVPKGRGYYPPGYELSMGMDGLTMSN